MPAQFFNFSRYFKKSSSDDSAKTSASSSGSSSRVVTGQTVIQKELSSSSSQNVSYSGIGPAPGGSVPYSGIGAPPLVSPFSSSTSLQKREGMDILSRLTPKATQALLLAAEKAKELHLSDIETEHLLWGLLHDAAVYQLISDCQAVPAEIKTEVEKNFKTGSFTGTPQFSPRVKKVLELSFSFAHSLSLEFISPEHLLWGLVAEEEGLAAQILARHHLTKEILKEKISGRKEEKEEKKKVSVLEEYTEDLTAKAKRGELDPVVARSWEIERVIHILSRRTKNNPVLIGEAGVGKTAIVEGLAQKIARGEVPETLLAKRILSLDLMSLIAGARHRGEFEERLKNVLKEIKTRRDIILFIDEIHNMVGAGAGSEGTMDASNILKPSLSRGEIQVVGTTTIVEYRRYIEKDPALERRFQPVLVAEPSFEAAKEMLLSLRDKYEAFHRVKISDEALEAAVRFSQRYITDRFLPDKAVDLIDEAAAAVRLPAISLPEEIRNFQKKLKRLAAEEEEAKKLGNKTETERLKTEKEETERALQELEKEYQKKKSTTTYTVTPEAVAEIVSRWTHIPVQKLTESESEKLLKLEEIIHRRLIDQEEAVAAVAEAVRRGRAGLKSNKRPIGSFIFLGPTGVGKTELAKTLAEVLFGSEEMMVRLDMTEYMEKHEVAKLIGAPPGYVGYEEGGQLTEAVRRRPYSVVLLDEIEKAHPDVFNILIQILDDGRLTDNKGHTISFKNTIFICTSNLGSALIQEAILKKPAGSLPAEKKEKEAKGGVSFPSPPPQNFESTKNWWEELSEKLLEELRKFFRPELLNRFDEVVIFKPLTKEQMGEIVSLQIKTLSRLLTEQGIALQLSEKARLFLVENGFDPLYGARPLRRVIQRTLENSISSLLIKGEVKAGDQILVESDGQSLNLKVLKKEKEEEKIPPVPEEKKEKTAGQATPFAFLCPKCGWEGILEKEEKAICPRCQSPLKPKEENLPPSPFPSSPIPPLSPNKESEEKKEESPLKKYFPQEKNFSSSVAAA